MSTDEGFFSRWARRKAGVPEPAPPPPEAASLPAAESVAAPAPAPPPEPEPEPPPTLDDVAQLDPQADFKRFVARDVDPTVKNAALKKLFTDPQWNVMDGLDVYIDDYGKPDPVPESVLRQMVQSQVLGLFREEEQAAKAQNPPPASVAAPAVPTAPDEDPDLRLQPDDAARSDGDPPGPGEDAGRER